MTTLLRRDYMLKIIMFPGLLAVAVIVDRFVFEPRQLERTPAEAAAFWKEHAARVPTFGPSLMRAAHAQGRAGDWEAARETVEQAVGNHPDNEGFALGLHDALKNGGHSEQALDQLAAFAATHPDCVECSHHLAFDNFELGRMKRARDHIKRFLGDGRIEEQGDIDFDVLLLAAVIYEAVGETERALGYANAAVLRDPSHPAANRYVDRLRGKPEAVSR